MHENVKFVFFGVHTTLFDLNNERAFCIFFVSLSLAQTVYLVQIFASYTVKPQLFGFIISRCGTGLTDISTTQNEPARRTWMLMEWKVNVELGRESFLR